MKFVILGGAFDPLHSEHIALIEGIISKNIADKIILVPSYNPPHKDKKLVPFVDRVAMLNIYAKNKANVIVDTIEGDENLADSFAYKIIPKLKEKYGVGKYYYAIGGDSMILFNCWAKPDLICKEVTLIVAERNGYTGLTEAIASAKSNYNADVVQLDLQLRQFSSTELKGRLELEYNLEDFILPEIANYIKEHNLYKCFEDVVNYLQQNLCQRTYLHSVRTTLFALKYANKLHLSYKKVFLSSLLHDVAKNVADIAGSYPNVSMSVKHQYLGKDIAKSILNIADEEILDAIEFHTTGKPNMSQLGKLVYVADKLEEHRDYPKVQELREAVDTDFDSGFAKVVKNQLNFLEKSAQSVDSLTKECAIWYNTHEK